MKLSIIIPVYNEKNSIIKILYKIQQVKLDNIEKEIIIVDDFSSDGTKEILGQIDNKIKSGNNFIAYENNVPLKIDNMKVFFQEQNGGKGSAIRRGLSEVTGNFTIIQDADLEYDPNDYSSLLEPIILNKAKVVYGSRYLNKSITDQYWTHYLANSLLTKFSNFLTRQKITDMETCYKVFYSEIIKKISIEQNRFGFEPEITAKISKMGIKIYEVPITYSGRKYHEGKKIGLKDGINALFCIIKYSVL